MTSAARSPALNLSAREIEFHDVRGREVHRRCVTLVARMRDANGSLDSLDLINVTNGRALTGGGGRDSIEVRPR